MKCYGIRAKNDKDGWIINADNIMFWSVSKAVAEAYLKILNNDRLEVAEFIEENGK